MANSGVVDGGGHFDDTPLDVAAPLT